VYRVSKSNREVLRCIAHTAYPSAALQGRLTAEIKERPLDGPISTVHKSVIGFNIYQQTKYVVLSLT
jgi:hypothetical protein